MRIKPQKADRIMRIKLNLNKTIRIKLKIQIE